jgi:hypothetical protein
VAAEYVRRILSIFDMLDDCPLAITVSDSAIQRLYSAGAFPFDGPVRELIKKGNLDWAEASDVVSIVHHILTRADHLQSVLGFADLLVTDVSLDPDIFIDSSLDRHDDWPELLGIVALHNTLHKVDAIAPLLITGCVTGSGSVSVRFDSLVELAERRNGKEPSTDVEGVRVTLLSKAASTIEEFSVEVSPTSLWTSATMDKTRVRAIQLAYIHSIGSGGHTRFLSEVPKFALGPKFIRSCVRYGFGKDSTRARRLISAVVDSVGGRTTQVHALRVDSGPESPQRTRGKNKAWRRDVDDDFHLHYWSGPDGVELGQVGPHDDFHLA